VTDRREWRPLPERGLSSAAVIAIGLVVVLFLITVVAVVVADTSQNARGTRSPFQTRRFDLYGLGFAYPRGWRPQSWADVSSFTSLITYLSPLR